MKAGFAKICITPHSPIRLFGFPERDFSGPSQGIHDDLFVRAAYFRHEAQEVIILSFDLLFFNRAQADRYTGAVARALDIRPRQVLLNTTHTHSGPMLDMGSWAFANYLEPEFLYHNQLEKATVQAACQAKSNACPATLWAGHTFSALPMSRRLIGSDGQIKWGPNPKGVVYNKVPVCLAKDLDGQVISLLFSVSCHPSTTYSEEISADFPGVTQNLLDQHLGKAASLFLQGVAGDTKPSVIANGNLWNKGTWNDVDKAGRMVATEVIQTVDNGLTPIEPEITTYLTEISLPLQPALDKATLEMMADDDKQPQLKRLWAQRQCRHLNGGNTTANTIKLTLHGVRLGRTLRLVGLDAEAVGELGWLIDKFFNNGVIFPMGYTNGAQLYLPTSHMIEKEGGYEVDSCWEYGLPASLRPGVESPLTEGLQRLQAQGI